MFSDDIPNFKVDDQQRFRIIGTPIYGYFLLYLKRTGIYESHPIVGNQRYPTDQKGVERFSVSAEGIFANTSPIFIFELKCL